MEEGRPREDWAESMLLLEREGRSRLCDELIEIMEGFDARDIPRVDEGAEEE